MNCNLPDLKRSLILAGLISVLMPGQALAVGQEGKPGPTELVAFQDKPAKKKKKKPEAKQGSPKPADGKNDPATGGPAGGTPPKPPAAPPEGQKAEELSGPQASSLAWPRERLMAYINAFPAAFRPRLLAIANTKDQNRLAKQAIEDPDGVNRMVATHTLTDQKLLAKVAGESTREEIRITAAQRLTGNDQPSLMKLIEKTRDGRVRGTAIPMVKDPALRAKLKADANPAAVAFDQKQAEEEAQKLLNSKSAGDRMRDVEVAVNVAVLCKCAMEDPDIHFADMAVKRLIQLRKTGKEGIDETTFEKIALGAKCLYPRRTALAHVSNKAVLAKLAEDRDDEIRSAVAERLDDPALLAKLARDPKSNVRSATINRLTDIKLLQNLAASDPDDSTRKHAQRRLDALKGKK